MAVVAHRCMGSIWSRPVGASFTEGHVVQCMGDRGTVWSYWGLNPEVQVHQADIILLSCSCTVCVRMSIAYEEAFMRP